MFTSATTAARHTRTDGSRPSGSRSKGRVATPADPDWDEVRAAWNLHVDQHPAAAVQAADAGRRRGHGAVGATVRCCRRTPRKSSPRSADLLAV